MRLFLALIAVLISSTISATDMDRYVAVVGVGEAVVEPNQATLTVRLVERNKTSEATSVALFEKAAGLVKSLMASGLTEAQISLDQLRIDPAYDRAGRQQILVGYSGQQTAKVRLTDLEKVGPVSATLLADVPGLEINLVYGVAQPSIVLEAARGQAIDDARRRAAAYASRLDAALGQVLVIEESGTESPRVRFALADSLRKYYRQNEETGALETVTVTGGRVQGLLSGTQADRGRATPLLSPEPIKVSVSVYAKFALR